MISFSFRWIDLTTGLPIPGATGLSYAWSENDRGKTLAIEVVATNAAGSSAPVLSAGVLIPGAPPPAGSTTIDSTAITIDATTLTIDKA
jgi:hypothetical protein